MVLVQTGNRIIAMWPDIMLSLSVFHWPSMKKDIINQKNKKIKKIKKNQKNKENEKNKNIKKK